jgi:hypothetical protein
MILGNRVAGLVAGIDFLQEKPVKRKFYYKNHQTNNENPNSS